MRHAYAVSLEHLHHAHFVFKRIWMRAPLARALAQKIGGCAIVLVRCAPHRTPATLANDLVDGAAEILRNPGRELTEVVRSEEHTSELQSLMRTSYAVFFLTKKNTDIYYTTKNRP